MPDPKDELPEGTDTVIAGASQTENEESLIVREPTARDKALDKIKSGGGKLSEQAADKARGFVGQGLERSSEALGNVSKLVGDTAAGLDERLGEEYGDYAVRKSPGVALAGAAIIGFALVRLVKSGLDRDRGEDDES
jgi:hypothetical protein